MSGFRFGVVSGFSRTFGGPPEGGHYIVLHRQAENDDKLVAQAQEHAKHVHQMDLTQEQALAMAKPE